jgi:hypothetical protein
MKLRVHENSLRLRLSRTEVEQFASSGWIECTVDFGGGAALHYAIESSTDATEPRALFESGRIRVLVPSAAARQWAETEQVGIEGSPAEGPHILVEKDFQCLHSGVEEADAYPNPLSGE